MRWKRVCVLCVRTTNAFTERARLLFFCRCSYLLNVLVFLLNEQTTQKGLTGGKYERKGLSGRKMCLYM